MTARWDFPRCSCRWDRYEHTCHKPTHVAFALREVPNANLPLILSAPCGDYIPAWVLEASA